MGTGTKWAVGIGIAAVVVVAGVLVYNAAQPQPSRTTPQLGDGSTTAGGTTGANAFDAFVAGINGATRITTAAIDANRRPATGTTAQNTGGATTGTATTGTTVRTG